MSARCIAIVPADELAALRELAAVAVQEHDNRTHYGPCRLCDLVDRWREIRRSATTSPFAPLRAQLIASRSYDKEKCRHG